jgi:hypothetical protein
MLTEAYNKGLVRDLLGRITGTGYALHDLRAAILSVDWVLRIAYHVAIDRAADRAIDDFMTVPRSRPG